MEGDANVKTNLGISSEIIINLYKLTEYQIKVQNEHSYIACHEHSLKCTLSILNTLLQK